MRRYPMIVDSDAGYEIRISGFCHFDNDG
jgi:hypothetical protein